MPSAAAGEDDDRDDRGRTLGREGSVVGDSHDHINAHPHPPRGQLGQSFDLGCHGFPTTPRGSPSIMVSGCIGDSMNPCLA